MAIFTTGNANIGTIVGRATVLLKSLRDTLTEIQQLEQWLAAQSQADLTALGFTAGDLSMLLSAMADANAVAQIYSTGLPPGTYPQPASAYTYANSQRQIIGPQLQLFTIKESSCSE